ncbi:MAG TPA: hypothetical protein PKI05_10120, partial [Thermogutta sp.]|nr:hypothetical protein [Thermogutta sp.]
GCAGRNNPNGPCGVGPPQGSAIVSGLFYRQKPADHYGFVTTSYFCPHLRSGVLVGPSVRCDLSNLAAEQAKTASSSFHGSRIGLRCTPARHELAA